MMKLTGASTTGSLQGPKKELTKKASYRPGSLKPHLLGKLSL